MESRDDEEHLPANPLVRALRAPGSPAELAREAEFVAAFRAAQQPQGSVRRLAGRVGIAATATVTTVVLTAGVAAAYGRVLPQPVQRLAHSVLGPVGVPAPHTRHRTTATPPAPPVTPPTKQATQDASPDASQPGSKPTDGPGQATASQAPGATTTPSPSNAPVGLPGTPAAGTGSPTSTPTQTGTHVPRVPAAQTIVASSGEAVFGGTVTVSGVVSAADGHVLGHRAVRLQERTRGEPWTTVARGSTAHDGSVSLASPELDRTTYFRLRTAHGVRSAVARVVEKPAVSASVTENGGTSSLAVTVLGGQPGDKVKVSVRRSGKTVLLATGTLGPDGTTVITTPTPRRRTSVLVRVGATEDHAAAGTRVTLENS
ncbi:MAG TPA: hypothetical protein VHZ06_03175 [Marmoricola sp.]|nr:hypothetical protein [Marmoricola sp.]